MCIEKYIIFLLIGICCLINKSFSQLHQSQNHKTQVQLRIGDKIPDLLVSNFLDDKHRSIKLSDLYQNRGLIINFWATWCVPCLKELPVLNEMAGKYHSKLNVLSIEYESPKLVENFLKQHKELEFSNINMIAGDTVLVEYLKHTGLPYNVWVDKKGIIRHFTNSEDIKEANIKDFLNNNLTVHEAKQVADWSFSKTFHLKDSAFQYRSILTGNTDGILSGFTFYQIAKPRERLVKRIFVFDQTISRLYRIALSKMFVHDFAMDYNNLIEFQVKDSLKYFSPNPNSLMFKNSRYSSMYDWQNENCYCYELTLPGAVKDSVAFDYMFDDLQRRFHLDVKVEKKKRLCTVITLAPGIHVNPLQLSAKDSSFYKITDQGIQAEHITLTQLFENINVQIRPSLQAVPLDNHYINETGIDYPIDVSIKYSEEKINYPEVKQLFEKKYGIQFKEEEREVSIYVIKEPI